MRRVHLSSKYRKDWKRVKRRGKNLRKLERIVDQLAANKRLDRRYRAHRLTGEMSAFWECHIEFDWLLLWSEDVFSVYLVRTGTHSDVFGD